MKVLCSMNQDIVKLYVTLKKAEIQNIKSKKLPKYHKK